MKPNNYRSILGLTAIIVVFCGFQTLPCAQDKSANIFTSLPDRATAIEAFIPEGWRLRQQIQSVSGKLTALELIEKSTPEEEQLMKRAMVVLYRPDPNSPLVRIGANDRLLECLGCMGASGHDQSEFQGDILVISKQSGTHSSWSQSWSRFRLDPETSRLRLIGEEIQYGEYNRRNRMSINFLTGEVILTEAGKPERKCQFSQPPIYFEDITGNGAEPWEQAIWSLFQSPGDGS